MTTENASGLPITQLGSTIKAHMRVAEKYESKADENYKAAGIHLVEAQRRCKAGEYAGGKHFSVFLLKECDVSSTRAYELINIANGTKTVEQIREATNLRKQAFRSGTESSQTRANAGFSSASLASSAAKAVAQHAAAAA